MKLNKEISPFQLWAFISVLFVIIFIFDVGSAAPLSGMITILFALPVYIILSAIVFLWWAIKYRKQDIQRTPITGMKRKFLTAVIILVSVWILYNIGYFIINP